jgi:endo-1,4-beta-xylanase
MRNHNFSQLTLRVGVSFLLLLLAACGGGYGGGGGNNNPPPNTATLAQNAAKHGLKVGAAADSQFLVSDSTYASVLGSEYNELTAENEMKFASVAPTSPTENYTGADALVSFAQAHQMAVRGHTLVWHQQVPAWVSPTDTPAQLNTILQNHITDEMTHFAGKVYAWDVVNEAFNDDGSGSTPATLRSTIWYDSPGIGVGTGTAYIEQAMKWAHAADSTAKLFYNDYNIETQNPKSDAVYAMAQDFTTRGVPLDGIGFQFHVDLSFDNPNVLASVASNFQRFAALGLAIHITELDIRLSDSSAASFAAQAKLYGELATICVQQPKCTTFQTWGFTDKYSWIPGFFTGMGWALPWDANYAKKPAYTSLLTAFQ